MKYIIGAYAASPSTRGENATDEELFYSEVSALPGFAGLEIAFDGSLHPFDEKWLLGRIKPNWKIVVTLIPGTVKRLAKSSEFGLASDSPAGQQSAIDFCEEARQAVIRINNAAGAEVVAAVEVHSAPTRGSGDITTSGESFAKSLTALGSRDWSDAKLVVEHCDAFVSGQVPAKGFLDLDAELEAVRIALRDSPTEFGVSINWARSVIEARQADGAVTHLKAARAAGLLAGVMFSSCATEPTAYGEPWTDAHLPPPRPDGVTGTAQYEAKASMLTRDEVHRALNAAGPLDALDFCGLKVSAPRSLNPDVQERIAIVKDSLTELRAAGSRF